MSLDLTHTTIKNILTRTTGYLRTVSSHSLQPYRGCTFGGALCGQGCYVQHNQHLLRGREWGGFLEVRTNAAQSYRDHFHRERRFAQKHLQPFSIFCSSATDPFVPQESTYHITESVLNTMCELPPDELILQTHTHRVTSVLPVLQKLAALCKLRVHVSIETDREHLPGLPPHGSPVARRFEACAQLKSAGLRTLVTVSPLLPLEDPDTFFATIARVADGVVLDHYIEGDGTRDGHRTRRTPLPAAIATLNPNALELTYRDEMARIAQRHLPGRVGINIDGFAGRFLPASVPQPQKPHSPSEIAMEHPSNNPRNLEPGIATPHPP